MDDLDDLFEAPFRRDQEGNRIYGGPGSPEHWDFSKSPAPRRLPSWHEVREGIDGFDTAMTLARLVALRTGLVVDMRMDEGLWHFSSDRMRATALHVLEEAETWEQEDQEAREERDLAAAAEHEAEAERNAPEPPPWGFYSSEDPLG